MTRRKYLKSGDKNPHEKIEVDIRKVNERIAGGERVKELAAELGIHPSTLYRKLRAYKDPAADRGDI